MEESADKNESENSVSFTHGVIAMVMVGVMLAAFTIVVMPPPEGETVVETTTLGCETDFELTSLAEGEERILLEEIDGENAGFESGGDSVSLSEIGESATYFHSPTNQTSVRISAIQSTSEEPQTLRKVDFPACNRIR